MAKFKDQWNLEMALDVMGSQNVDAQVWAEAVKWLLLYGPPHIQEIIGQASGEAMRRCFPEVEARGYSEDGRPYYDLGDIARALGIPEEDAVETLAGISFEEGVEILVEGSRVYKVH